MSDEEKLDRALGLADNFSITELNFKLMHPNYPPLHYLETDNIAQKGRTIFVFECKLKREGKAIKQLIERHKSLILYKDLYIRYKRFRNFTTIRLFYCSFKRRSITEFDIKGNKITLSKFDDVNKLAEILRNI